MFQTTISDVCFSHCGCFDQIASHSAVSSERLPDFMLPTNSCIYPAGCGVNPIIHTRALLAASALENTIRPYPPELRSPSWISLSSFFCISCIFGSFRMYSSRSRLCFSSKARSTGDLHPAHRGRMMRKTQATPMIRDQVFRADALW